MKIRKSITIDSDINTKIEEQAKVESRNFSNMIEQMAKKYLNDKNNYDLTKYVQKYFSKVVDNMYIEDATGDSWTTEQVIECYNREKQNSLSDLKK